MMKVLLQGTVTTLASIVVCCFLFRLSSAVIPTNNFINEVEYQCIQNCTLQDRTGTTNNECDYKCSIQQCSKGCSLSKTTMRPPVSCQTVCANNGSHYFTTPEIHCVIGCNNALSKYFEQLQKYLGKLAAPTLVADSLKSTSLKLRWPYLDANKFGLTVHVQWIYEDTGIKWQFCENVTHLLEEYHIQNLRPYTKYRFRMALRLSQREEQIVSSSSVVMSTLAFGAPISSPVIVRASAVDYTRISINWEPGSFLQGPLLSYMLQITDQTQLEVKEIPADTNFYMFRNLQPSRNYTITVSMRNAAGIGPPARVQLETPTQTLAKYTENPVLILATDHSVLKQGTDIFDEPIDLFLTKFHIYGIAIHVEKQSIYVSNSELKIYQIQNSNETNIFMDSSKLKFSSHDLSVDWLHNELYILTQHVQHDEDSFFGWNIARCDLDSKNLTIVYEGLLRKPNCIEVDPFNGFLFWVMDGFSDGGLYRLDMFDIRYGHKNSIRPTALITDPYLGAFSVDHTNYRLLVSHQDLNTINALSLDGKEFFNARPNVIKSKFHKVISFVAVNSKFYWTDGDTVFFEEYHISDDSYFHNSYPELIPKSYRHLLANTGISQPTPVPINPPTDVQVVFGSKYARIVWSSPVLLGIKGKGAWQDWSYDIVVGNTNKSIAVRKQTRTTKCEIDTLTESTMYVIKIAAFTKAGYGPWSLEFKGSTLRSSASEPVMFWSSKSGFFKSDVTGTNVQTLISEKRLKEFHIIDITWHGSLLFLSTNNSRIYTFNMTSQAFRRLAVIEGVGSIATDWIGSKLYWSNPRQQLIMRASLNGSHQEPLPIMTIAKELKIDSTAAYIYWSTGYGVECAHLNGIGRIEYHKTQPFSGRQIMGLALDLDKRFVYWTVREGESSTIYKAIMATGSTTFSTQTEIIRLEKAPMLGPICYFQQRFLWIRNNSQAAISDLNGNNIAMIRVSNVSELVTVKVMDLNYQNKKYDFNVVPSKVDVNTIVVHGTSDDFNVTWAAVQNVNLGIIFYEVKLQDLPVVITPHNTIHCNLSVDPYSELHILIRATTYWASSVYTKTVIRSPPSIPSTPTNLRSYVTASETNAKQVSVTIRWSPPKRSNGILLGYKLHWCHKDECAVIIKESSSLQTEMQAMHGSTYYIQVQGFTAVGDGYLSKQLSVDCSIIKPIPIILMSNNKSIVVYDLDDNTTLNVINGITPVIMLDYIIKEEKFFWINILGELWSFYAATQYQMKHLKSGAQKFSADWVQKVLYVLHFDVLKKIDLNYSELQSIGKISNVYHRQLYDVKQLQCNPFESLIYVLHEEQLTIITYSGRRLNYIQPCSQHLSHFALHYESYSVMTIFFVDYTDSKYSIIAYNGSKCTKTIKNKWDNLKKIQINTKNNILIYQSNMINMKQRDDSWTNFTMDLNDFVLFGSHIQPLPPERCLGISAHVNGHQSATLLSKSSNTLTLRMPEIYRESQCNNITQASSIWTVQLCDYRYQCAEITTLNKTLDFTGLIPFTEYNVHLRVRNVYMKTVINLTSTWFQTASGTPSIPMNVTVSVLTPVALQVSWNPPRFLNGATVHYEIYWKTEGTLSGVRQNRKPSTNQPKNQSSKAIYNTIISKLKPNTTYTVWIRAYGDTSHAYVDSPSKIISTYHAPNKVELVNATAHSLALMWKSCCFIATYAIEFCSAPFYIWKPVPSQEQNEDGTVTIKLVNLLPKTMYRIRLLLTYKTYIHHTLIWPPEDNDMYSIQFETLGACPSPPGAPAIQYLRPNVYKIWWEASKNNGATIEMYLLEAQRSPLSGSVIRVKRANNRTVPYFFNSPTIHSNVVDYSSYWQIVYNGSDTYWVIDGLSNSYKYTFRVKAYNVYGWSEPSELSTEFDMNAEADSLEHRGIYSPTPSFIAFATFTPFSVFVAISLLIWCRRWNNSPSKKVLASKESAAIIEPLNIFTPDLELATLQELPQRGVHNTNTLYMSTLVPQDKSTTLKQIRRDQITLLKFLGSGAFGKVYEGKAYISNERRVAVKSLRSGATEQEKSDFLQEAELMSNFKHENIVEVIGVCIDNDPHFIIMELMEGGDLLTFLRSARNQSLLSHVDLLKMCRDVSKGCRYLEEMHFVHRDLACRNCLVSSALPSEHLVKIGDFGLARDIYNSDYYRKEGEGLLPVRWMAPESLMDGVFTSQSDVWAFGVLLWEIMTLGQQPYPARNNLEVLHYVRSGGRLNKPNDCPEELHRLMMQCWTYEADSRPSFKYCVEILQALYLEESRPNEIKTVADEQKSLALEDVDAGFNMSHEATFSGGFSNRIYFQNHCHTQREHSSDYETHVIDDNTRGDDTQPLTIQPQLLVDCTDLYLNEASNSEEKAKYLEILYVKEPNDGYEVPNEQFQDCLTSTS